MLRTLLACLAAMICANAAFAEPVTLRPRIEASGPNVTLGDVFQGAGEAASRAIAPAPSPGQVASLPMPLLEAVASAAGLAFTPPAGVSEVRVVRPGGMRATLPAAASPQAAADIVIRRGDSVTLVLQRPGMEIIWNGVRAEQNGAVGQRIRLVNPSSNRSIDAVVTGPGAARADAL